MKKQEEGGAPAIDAVEEREWMDSVDALVHAHGPRYAAALLDDVARP